MAKEKSSGKKFIRLTRDAIRAMFDECNRAYFNNEVKAPEKIELWTPNRRTVGMVRPLYVSKAKGWCACLHISKQFRWTAENLRKVVVHEMIHLYIGDYLRPLRWWERWFPFLIKEHDDEFKNVMDDLNMRYDLNIGIRFPEMKVYRRY